MIGPFGQQVPTVNLGQHRPQMNQRRSILQKDGLSAKMQLSAETNFAVHLCFIASVDFGVDLIYEDIPKSDI